MNNLNVLVIHPSDPTTDFLCEVYKDINAVVIRQRVSKSKLKKHIKDADKVIILGHGNHHGMGFVNKHDSLDLIIDSNMVYLLRDKRDSVFVWCHARSFVEKYGLDGFCTGMFISEFEEAEMYKIEATEREINTSNKEFSRLLSLNLFLSSEDMKRVIKNLYTIDSDVCKYNNNEIA